VSFVDIAIIGGIDDSPEIIEHKKKTTTSCQEIQKQF
jgi:hypothetical protein